MTGCDGFSHMVWSVVVFVGLRSPHPAACVQVLALSFIQRRSFQAFSTP